MSKTLKIYLSKKVNNVSEGRKIVEAEVVRETNKCVWVKLNNGDVIKRKKERDIVYE